MKKFLLILFFLISIFCPLPIFAKKKIGISQKTSTYGLVISPKLRKDRKALIVNFSNLSRVSSFAYELTYLTNGIEQGVYGTVTPKGENSTVRELLFGTCSGNVCRYHSGIQDMKFVVTANLKNGKKIIKRYRVKP